MNNFKRAQVIMLPHNNIDTKITLYKTASGKPLNLSTNIDILSYHTNQHLYIISDDEIKENDWFLWKNKIYQASNKNTTKASVWSNEFPKGVYAVIQENCKKIIATTNTSLEFLKYCPEISEDTYKRTLLPQPSQQFIEKYIEEYNKGNIIKDVLVEYENIMCPKEPKCINCYSKCLIGFKLKINPKDNTITIKKLKESWNREEVIDLLNNFIWDYSENRGYNQNKIDDWIKENL